MRRNFGLDLLRCIAILVVLANHALLFLFLHFYQLREGHFPDVWLVRVAPLFAMPSVEVLFVLSGFLIGTMMIRTFEGEGSFWKRTREFWLRRWFRTVPNYYLFLVVNAALAAWVLDGTVVGEGRFSLRHLVFAQNLAWPEATPFFYVEAWSLALDEWFYLILPLLVGLFAKALGTRLRTAFLLATVALIAVPVAGRLLMPPPPDIFEWDLVVRRVTLWHLDATGWGVLGAAVNRWMPESWSWRPGAKAAMGLACLLLGLQTFLELPPTPWPNVGDLTGWAWWPRLANALGLTAVSLGTFLALPWVIARTTGRARLSAVTAGFSNYSYSVYLAHMPVLYVLRATIAPADATIPVLAATTAVWLLATLSIAALVHHSFEKPVSDLRERFTRRVDASPFGPAPPP